MRALVVNQFNSDNLGDKLLNAMLIDELHRNGIDTDNLGFAQTTPQEISVDENSRSSIFSFVNKKIIPYFKYKLRYQKRLMSIQNKIDTSKIDLIIIGGGQLVKHKNVFMYCLSSWINFAKTNNIKTALYGISIDNNINNREKKFYKKIFDKIDYFNVRDFQSKKLFNKYFSINVDYSPDIAFSYKENNKNKKNNSVLIMPYDYITAKYTFKNSLSLDSYYNMIYNMIDKDKELIISATTSSDLKEGINFSKYLEEKGVKSKVINATSVEELVRLMQQSSLVITGRMHAMILGKILNCEVKPLIISNKIEVFVNEYINNSNIDYKKVSNDAVDGVKRLINHFIK